MGSSGCMLVALYILLLYQLDIEYLSDSDDCCLKLQYLEIKLKK